MVAAHDDEDVPAVEVGADVGHADAVEEQLALAQVLHRVRGERLELVGQPGPRLRSSRPATASPSSSVAGADGCVRRSSMRPVLEGQRRALLDRHDVRADVVDERDAGGDEDLGAEVGVAAGDRRDGVDHGRRAGTRPAPRR